MISKYHNTNVGEVFGNHTLIDGTVGYEGDPDRATNNFKRS